MLTPKRWLASLSFVPSVTLLLLGAGLVEALHTVRRPDYPATAHDPSLELQDNGLRLREQSCDVLIDGDSTAAVGIDPTVVTARTGLTACNIATSRPIVDDLGTLPLDTFLQHNPKPKLIVLQYGAEDFYRSDRPWQHVGPYAPLAMVARNLPLRSALRVMRSHPAETVQFEVYVLKHLWFPPAGDGAAANARYRRALLHAAASRGQLDLDLPAESVCDATAVSLNGPLDADHIQHLRMRYERQGIAVLIRAAPLPACDPQLARFEHDLAPYVDGNVEALPVNLFTAGRRHPTQSGSRIATLGLVSLIEAHQAKFLANSHAAATVPPRPNGTGLTSPAPPPKSQLALLQLH